MSITLGTISFGTNIHGTPVVSPWEYDISLQHFPGVYGETEFRGKWRGREITIPYHLYGYGTLVLLLADVVEMSSAIGTTGTLNINLGGGDSSSFTEVTFRGFFPEENPWKDGSGVNGWNQRGMLHFRQNGQE
jgi:hypothetical protein